MNVTEGSRHTTSPKRKKISPAFIGSCRFKIETQNTDVGFPTTPGGHTLVLHAPLFKIPAFVESPASVRPRLSHGAKLS